MNGVKKGTEYCMTIPIGGVMHDVTGRKMNPNGYYVLCIKTHPNSDMNGCVMEHRVVMEMCLGRYLKTEEIIHHLNDKKYDNRISNLKILTQSEHIRLHNLERGGHSKETKELMSLKAKKRFEDRKSHPMYKDVDDELVVLYKNGMNLSEIGRTLGITRQAVRNKINYLGVVK